MYIEIFYLTKFNLVSNLIGRGSSFNIKELYYPDIKQTKLNAVIFILRKIRFIKVNNERIKLSLIESDKNNFLICNDFDKEDVTFIRESTRRLSKQFSTKQFKRKISFLKNRKNVLQNVIKDRLMDRLIRNYGCIKLFMYSINSIYNIRTDNPNYKKIASKKKSGRVKFKKRYSHKIYYEPVY
jgi:hypothetical protein